MSDEEIKQGETCGTENAADSPHNEENNTQTADDNDADHNQL